MRARRERVGVRREFGPQTALAVFPAQRVSGPCFSTVVGRPRAAHPAPARRRRRRAGAVDPVKQRPFHPTRRERPGLNTRCAGKGHECPWSMSLASISLATGSPPAPQLSNARSPGTGLDWAGTPPLLRSRAGGRRRLSTTSRHCGNSVRSIGPVPVGGTVWPLLRDTAQIPSAPPAAIRVRELSPMPPN